MRLSIVPTEFWIVYFIIAFIAYVIQDKGCQVDKSDETVKFFTVLCMSIFWPITVLMIICYIIIKILGGGK